MTTKLETYLESQRWIPCYNTGTETIMPYAPCFLHGVSTEKMLLSEENDRKFAGSDDLLVLLVSTPPFGFYNETATRSGPLGCEEYAIRSWHRRTTGWFGVTSDVEIPYKKMGLVTLDFPAVASCKGSDGFLVPGYDNVLNVGLSYFGPAVPGFFCFPGEGSDKWFITDFIQVLLNTEESLDNGLSTLCVVQPKFNNRSNS